MDIVKLAWQIIEMSNELRDLRVENAELRAEVIRRRKDDVETLTEMYNDIGRTLHTLVNKADNNATENH